MWTRSQISILTLLLAGISAASADTLSYTVTGSYPSGPVTELDGNFNIIGQGTVPVDALVAPGAAYQFQFSIPTPLPAGAPNAPDVETNAMLTYSLNGNVVFSSPDVMCFFPDNAGGFVIPEYGLNAGSDTYYWSWVGPQLYSGTTDSPTLLTGSFTSAGVSEQSPSLQFVGVDNTLWELPDGAVVTVTDNAVASEPGSESLLLAAGLFCIAVGVVGARRHPKNSPLVPR